VTYLTLNFTLEEMIFSEYSARHGIDNTPTQEIEVALANTAHGLERIRELIGCPITVTSGYRCAKLNSAIGGQPDSQHTKGEAADIKTREHSPRELTQLIANHIKELGVDQCILEFDSWTHVSFSDSPRYELLTINEDGTHPGIA